MSEIVGEKIFDLETRTSRFDKEGKSEEEIFEFKTNSNKKLQEIRRDLIGLLTELQEGLPPDPKEKSLHFSGYGLRFTLSRLGVQDSRAPYENRPVEYIVDGFMYPNLKIYKNARHPSPDGAKDLWKQIIEKEKNNGYKMKGNM